MLDKLDHGKDKAMGKIKETAGKWMEDDELEFQGKAQGMKAAIGEKADDLKESVVSKANNIMDKTNDLLDKVDSLGEDKRKKKQNMKWENKD